MKKFILAAVISFSGLAQADTYFISSGAIGLSQPIERTAPGQLGVVSEMCVPFFDYSIAVLARLRFTVSAEERVYKYYNAKNYCDITVRWSSPFLPDPRAWPFNFTVREHRSCQDPANAGHYQVQLDCKGAAFDSLRKKHKGQVLRSVIRHEVIRFPDVNNCITAVCRTQRISARPEIVIE